jgi:hypothetical protein
MLRRINNKAKAAYERAGWHLTESGKAYAPAGLDRLSPTARPPGFSQLPLPRRRWREDRPAPTVPYRLANISEIPGKLRTLYSPASGGSASTGYVRGPHGDVLASFRDAKAADPLAAPITKRRSLTKTQWAALLAVAEPLEREHFLRDLACKRLTIIQE